MNTYWLVIGCAVCFGLLAGIFIFAIVFGDTINDRNHSREAQRLALTEPIITPADREIARQHVITRARGLNATETLPESWDAA